MLSAALLCLVVGVTDGDTLKARCGEPGSYQQVTVRLAAIDAPERRQPFGNASRQHLADLCFKQWAQLTQRGTDRYGRMVANVACREKDAAHAQVTAGLAWVFKRYAKREDAALFEREAEARAQRVGLWSDARPVPPWEYRASERR